MTSLRATDPPIPGRPAHPLPGRLTRPSRRQKEARRTWRTPAGPVGKVDDQDGGLAALVALGGEHGAGLGGEPGVAAVGLAAEGRDDHLVQPPYRSEERR